MKAVILAAGVGKRLSVVTRHTPKALIQFGGRSLLARHLDALSALGIKEVVLVVGYKQELIREEVESCKNGLAVRFLVNKDYERGSIGSLWIACQELTDDMVIMDADVLYHSKVLERLVTSVHGNALLLDETVAQETEECMAAVLGNRVVGLTKKDHARYDFVGEGVGFLRVRKADVPSLINSVETCIQEGRLDMEYEDALEGFFGEVSVGYEKIGGLPWIEIDFPEDIERAKKDILPQLM